jgi:DHA3 family tetracycline resistance protein-like MFS transporter
MRSLSALHHRPFALLWAGRSVSSLGDAIYYVALTWWVIETTGSAAALGVVAVCSFAPMLLFVLVGGIAVDRFPRLWLMLASDLVRGTAVAVISLLALRHQLLLVHVDAVAVLFGLVRAFFAPAYTAVVPDLVPAERLTSANALTDLTEHLSGLAGPALGALVTGLGGTGTAFLVDAASFYVSAACLLALFRVPSLRRPGSRGTGALSDLHAGLAVVLRSPWLWLTISISAVLNITESGPRNVVFPLLVKDTLHSGVAALGILYSLFAAGSVGAAVGLGHIQRLHHRGLLTYGGWVVSGVMMVGVGLPITSAGVGLLMVVWGACFQVTGMAWTTALQERVPRELQGRVSSIDYLGSFSLLPVGYGAAGLAADHLGSAVIFMAGGALTAAVAGLGLLQPAIRAVD